MKKKYLILATGATLVIIVISVLILLKAGTTKNNGSIESTLPSSLCSIATTPKATPITTPTIAPTQTPIPIESPVNEVVDYQQKVTYILSETVRNQKLEDSIIKEIEFTSQEDIESTAITGIGIIANDIAADFQEGKGLYLTSDDI